jgi:hypothetical protein
MDTDTSSIGFNDNNISDFITLKITRLDNVNVDTEFSVKFPDSHDYLYPVNTNDTRLNEILLPQPLKWKGNQATVQFRLYGTKIGRGSTTDPFRLELWWINGTNQTHIISQDKLITVEIH